ncbi:response regulator [Dechloromonas sp. ZS-1]|uniref:response regulator n=1 Tax=Dechloromonas sp. ZS-1 TaxID=3138067 RepID=UPI0031FD618F
MDRTKNYYTTREAAKLLAISVRTAQQWVDRKILEGWKTEGGHRRISAMSVDRLRHKSGQVSDGSFPAPSLRVLIIEDNQSMLRLYRINFSQWPFPAEIFSAPNGFEGLVMVGEIAPHLLICDLRLPGVNGFQIVRSLREMPRYRDLFIVVVSGMELTEIDAHGGLDNSIDFLEKPVSFKRLKFIAENVFNTTAASRTGMKSEKP